MNAIQAKPGQVQPRVHLLEPHARRRSTAFGATTARSSRSGRRSSATSGSISFEYQTRAPAGLGFDLNRVRGDWDVDGVTSVTSYWSNQLLTVNPDGTISASVTALQGHDEKPRRDGAFRIRRLRRAAVASGGSGNTSAGCRTAMGANRPHRNFGATESASDDRDGALVARAVVGAARPRLLLGQRRGSAEHRAQDQQQHEHLSQGDLLSTGRRYCANVAASRYRFGSPDATPSCYNGGGVRGV